MNKELETVALEREYCEVFERTIAELQRALLESRIPQSRLAARLQLDRAVVCRRLNGRWSAPTLKALSAIALAMDHKLVIQLVPRHETLKEEPASAGPGASKELRPLEIQKASKEKLKHKIVELHRQGDKTYKEIADQLGLPAEKKIGKNYVAGIINRSGELKRKNWSRIVGKKIGDWTVICVSDQSRPGRRLMTCICVCGVKRDVSASNLHSGASKGCGCRVQERRRSKMQG